MRAERARCIAKCLTSGNDFHAVKSCYLPTGCKVGAPFKVVYRKSAGLCDKDIKTQPVSSVESVARKLVITG